MPQKTSEFVTGSWNYSDGLYNPNIFFTVCLFFLWDNLGIFGPISAYMFLFFLRTIQHFLMEFSRNVPVTTLMVTILKKIRIILPSTRDHLEVFLDTICYMFLYLLRTAQYLLVEFVTNVFDINLMVSLLKHCFTSHVPFCWGTFLSIFGAILVLLYLLTYLSPVLRCYTPWKHQKTWSFSHIFMRFSNATLGWNGFRTFQYFLMKFCSDGLGITVMVNLLKNAFRDMFPSSGTQFVVRLGPFWSMFFDFLRTSKYFLLNFVQMFVVLLLQSLHFFFTSSTSFGGHFGLFLDHFGNMFLYFLRTIHYFWLNFSRNVLDITLNANTLKTFLHNFSPSPRCTHS